MTKPTIRLPSLTDSQLERRINSAERRIYAAKEELAWRGRRSRYGTETPLIEYYTVACTVQATLLVKAQSVEDATAVLECDNNALNVHSIISRYHKSPGSGIYCGNDFAANFGTPELVECKCQKEAA